MNGKMVWNIPALVLAVCLFAPQMLTGQATSAPGGTPTFEVASIRQNMNPKPAWRMSFTADGVSAVDVTLLWALQEAYGVYDENLWSGGPAWLDKARFDIQAKFDVEKYPGITLDQRRTMLQQLLADRFRVAVHHESKEFPLYALVVAKGGPKFEETKPEELRQSPTYGVICMHTRGGKGVLEMQGCSMPQFVSSLSGQAQLDLGRKVVDQTGLSGRYTISLHWTPVDTVASAPADSAALGMSGPSIFTALKEQLGLKLKPIKGPLDTIVIDHAEMPSEN